MLLIILMLNFIFIILSVFFAQSIAICLNKVGIPLVLSRVLLALVAGMIFAGTSVGVLMISEKGRLEERRSSWQEREMLRSQNFKLSKELQELKMKIRIHQTGIDDVNAGGPE